MKRRPSAAAVCRSERGQTLLLFVAIFTVLLVMGAFAVDQGMWLGHRRVAQKDADTAARGGALVYLRNLNTGFGCNEAAQEAAHVAQHNGVDVPQPSSCQGTDPNTVFTGISSCTDYKGNTINNVPSVEAQLNEHQGSLFSNIFGVSGMDTGAVATACVGMPSSFRGSDPFYIAPNGVSPACFQTDGQPLIGATCVFKTDSQPQQFGGRGVLSLANSSSACTDPSKQGLAQQVAIGSQAVCNVGDTVNIAQGNNIGPVDKGMNCRLVGGCYPPNNPGEGFCDASRFHDPNGRIPPFTGNLTPTGIDDFTEVFSLPTGGPPGPNWASTDQTLIANICSNGKPSPRIMTIIIGAPCPSTGCKQTITVAGFATFYAFGCVEIANQPPYDVMGPIDIQCANTNNNGLEGIFVKAFIPEGGGTPIPPVPGGSLSIFLVR